MAFTSRLRVRTFERSTNTYCLLAVAAQLILLGAQTLGPRAQGGREGRGGEGRG